MYVNTFSGGVILVNWKCEVVGNVLIVRLTGELDLHITDDMRNTLDTFLDDPQIKHVIFNLSQANYIDSSGLGVMLGRYKRVVQRGGKVLLVSPQPQVRKILELSGLMTIMEECNDEEEALGKI